MRTDISRPAAATCTSASNQTRRASPPSTGSGSGSLSFSRSVPTRRFYDGRDTGYASYRSQLWMRWPSAGPTDTFGTPDAYHELVRTMVESGVLLDDGMIYFDARLSRHYPTVEIRVADVCVDLEDTLLVAALCRALVDTAAAEAARGDPVPQMPTSLLRSDVLGDRPVRSSRLYAGHPTVHGAIRPPAGNYIKSV
jgi:Glutamate-cysteine ligase family 2(GCS2)